VARVSVGPVTMKRACPRHGEDAACLDCQDGDTTDGVGFPHPSNCKRRTPLRECAHCKRFVPREQWRQDNRKPPFRVGCETCVPEGTAAGPFPRKQRAAKEV
jgi:hypothetical protein